MTTPHKGGERDGLTIADQATKAGLQRFRDEHAVEEEELIRLQLAADVGLSRGVVPVAIDLIARRPGPTMRTSRICWTAVARQYNDPDSTFPARPRFNDNAPRDSTMSQNAESEWLTRKRRIDPRLEALGWTLRPFAPGISLASSTP